MSTPEHPTLKSPLNPNELRMRVFNAGGAWLLECRPGFETLMFRSSGAAETAGRTIATRFACSGQGVQMAIEDLRHALVGTRTFFPPPGADPAMAGAVLSPGGLP